MASEGILNAGAGGPRAGAAKTTSKKKNPKFDEAFQRLREIMRKELQEPTFKALTPYIMKTAKDRQLFPHAPLTTENLKKIVQGVQDDRTNDVLIACSEYVRTNLIKKRGKTSARFDAWVNEFAAPEQTSPEPEAAVVEQDAPATPPAARASTPAVAAGEDERADGHVVSWLFRTETDHLGSAPQASTGWPVSLDATVGLDRTAQVAICVGCGADALLRALLRVEAVLKSVDKAGEFPPRAWSIERGWLAESAAEAAIIELSASDLAKISKDTVEGVVQRHFERHSVNPTSSVVLAIPASAASAALRVADVLRGSIGADYCASIDLLTNAASDVDRRRLRNADAAFLDIIRDANAMDSKHQEAIGTVTTERLRDLHNWLSGKTPDEKYFGQLNSRDLKLVMLSGRLGFGSDRPSPNAVHRSTALVKAAAGNCDLLYALGSLPIEPETVEELIHSPIHVRAVAGLVTTDEMLAVPVPWFRKPISTWRHGRGLSVWGDKRDGLKQRTH